MDWPEFTIGTAPDQGNWCNGPSLNTRTNPGNRIERVMPDIRWPSPDRCLPTLFRSRPKSGGTVETGGLSDSQNLDWK